MIEPTPLEAFKGMPLSDFLNGVVKGDLTASADDVAEVLDVATLNRPEEFARNIGGINNLLLGDQALVTQMSDDRLAMLSRSVSAPATQELFPSLESLKAPKSNKPTIDEMKNRESYVGLTTALEAVVKDRDRRGEQTI